jgi:hypothetical protein
VAILSGGWLCLLREYILLNKIVEGQYKLKKYDQIFSFFIILEYNRRDFIFSYPYL